MRHIILYSCISAMLLLTLPGCRSEAWLYTSFHEPALDGLHYLYSTDGYTWDSIPGTWLRPAIGNDRTYTDYFADTVATPKFYPQHMMRDPSICQGPDGTYHLVWTLSWNGENAFGYASSRDLQHWSEQRKIPVMTDSLTNNVWAPEVSYDPDYKLFFIIWSSSIPTERYTEADRLGQNKAQRLYYTTTPDFVTFSDPAPYYDPGFNSIDAFLVRRSKDDYVLVVKDNRKPGYSDLFCVTSKSPYGPFSSTTEKFTSSYCEGPTVVKVGDTWIIYYDAYREYRFGAAATKDFNTFENIDSQISLPKGHKHGTIIKIPRKLLKSLLLASKKIH